jgi:hypothetical protein
MSEEQHSEPHNNPNRFMRIFTFLSRRKSHRQQDKDNSNQETSQRSQINSRWRTFTKDYGFQIIAILINGTLAWYTAKLYNQATSQSQSASISAQAARAAVAEYRRSNDLARQAFERNSESSERTIELTEKSVQTQEQSLETDKFRFEIENRSYIQVSDIKITQLKPNMTLKIDYYVTNFGKQPVIITDFKYSMDLSFIFKYDADTGLADRTDVNNIFIPADKFISGTAISNRPITADEYNRILANQEFVFLRGAVIYTDPVTGQNRKYGYNFSPYVTPESGTRVIRNKDKPFKIK